MSWWRGVSYYRQGNGTRRWIPNACSTVVGHDAWRSNQIHSPILRVDGRQWRARWWKGARPETRRSVPALSP